MPKQKVEEWNLFKCLSCKNQPEFTSDTIQTHLRVIHRITKPKGTRKILFHLDGTDFYQSDYEYEINGVKLVQRVRRKRDKESMAYWR